MLSLGEGYKLPKALVSQATSESLSAHQRVPCVVCGATFSEKTESESLHDAMQVLEAALVCRPGAAKVHVQLDTYVQATAEGCCMFLQREQVPGNQQRLKSLSKTATLREALSGACIIEYPILHVYLASEAPQLT